ncbi:hypothetical protein NEAUS04_0449 [Nematocida ausubeli]|uniref:Uncharacterized protein n=2 Tax=Nematocida ausubeli (strain ATCC PRA-371 / ERTm2) TaxID=1913371 RepID=A0A086J1I5_NEMA1|nr:uncharacterized protein NESG_01115 [Nematocida ausubeli]KAI5132517.1 hypothetical protein NEAUS07_0179 [Nematocida ausubeli]KAI5135108.1 hypothetical protein NEAUS06_1390 [Nematocida ausubeli]KAI5147056.1 hypothetical protein NEAUS05_0387 [Nematocida ausubeli]KAI5161335.1 hypothetical protein NEAUS04_0449 [Nematocida ausubeli]KFG26003.1 hypothetical protein NESG_01115 [Nematocida ausubeli]
MNLLSQIFLLSAALLAVPFARAIGHDAEISYFSENTPGRLFSVGKKRYIAFTASKDAMHVEIDDDREAAAQLYIRIIRDGPSTYGIIMSAEDHDVDECDEKHKEFGSGKGKQYLGCPTMVVDSEAKGKIMLKRFSIGPEFKFFFSPVVLPGFHAFRVYHKKKCLAISEDGDATTEECEYNDINKKSTQLFVWVDNALFIKNYNPMQTINQDLNPASPYYSADNKNPLTFWK